jgi:glycosyltransferase involved in cell wall biosynthesis
MEPYIVLVTLVHNRKHLVGLALQSAAKQTLSKDKWIHLIIDNASTDGADKVCEVFAKKHKHIFFERRDKNYHQMPSYNFAIDWIDKNFPDAEVMVHLDSDDELKKDALKMVHDTFQKHPNIGQTYSGFDIINKKGVTIHKNHAKARLIPNQLTDAGQKKLRKFFIASNPVGHLRAMRIKCLKDIGGFDESRRFATDFNMAGRMLEKYYVIKIDKSLYRWRQHDDQVERHYSPEQTKNWKDLQKYYKECWIKNGLI